MESFNALRETVSAALVSTTRSATRIAGADIAFQRSLDPEAGAALDSQNARLLKLAQRLLANAATNPDVVGLKLPNVEVLDEENIWRGVVDIIDSLLDKADISLDEYTGVIKRLSPGADQTAVTTKPRANPATPRHLAKPQLLFEHAPNNYQTGPFRPLLTSKPHAKIPLEVCLQTFKDEMGREQYPHPYQTEIEDYEFPPTMYTHSGPKPYQPWDTTTATFVDTPEALAAMLAELKSANEIAVDLEHHDNRSYIGIVSLMQISTREKDWIVDTLKPWRRQLECLNEVFADPNIVKVLHGAFMDVMWLQRDLGLYLVGLFDTYHACRSLGYPGASLKYLLERFIRFQAQKQYQLADWRVRPLPIELFEYARADTHFLLFIFDNLRNELVAKSDFSNPEMNKVEDVLSNSKKTALQRYEYPVYEEELGLGSIGWHKLVRFNSYQLTPQQFAVFKAVHKWRDDVARAEDESPIFIMPNHAVYSIAKSMPMDKPALFSIVQHVSHTLRARADEVILAINKAKEQGVNGPDFYVALQRAEDAIKAGQSRTAPTRAPVSVPASAPALVPAPALAPYPVETSALAEAVKRPDTMPVEVDTAPLRAIKSSFWGGLISGGHVEQQQSVAGLDVDLAIPLPPLTAEVFASGAPAHNEIVAIREKPSVVVDEDQAPEDQRTDTFVVKQAGGRKRKRMDAAEESLEVGAAHDPLQKQEDEIMLESGEQMEQEVETSVQGLSTSQSKKALKKAKKEKKQADKLARTQSSGADEPAFDYASAPSMLHAQGSANPKDKKKKDTKNVSKGTGFNPFSQMGNAPKGLPKSQKEVAGKSKTFSS